MSTTVIYVERQDQNGEWQELEIEINGSHSFGTPAKLSGHPDNWYPAEPADTEIESAVCKTKQFAHLFNELTDKEKDQAMEALVERAADEYEMRLEAQAEARVAAYERE